MIAACAAVFAVTTTMAQQAQPVPVKPVEAVQQGEATNEVSTASAKLKEAHGYLSREIAMLGREIGPDATGTPEQAALRTRMKSTLEGLEASLTAVNSLKGEEWKAAKAKADAIREEAMTIITERRSAREVKK